MGETAQEARGFQAYSMRNESPLRSSHFLRRPTGEWTGRPSYWMPCLTRQEEKKWTSKTERVWQVEGR
jgi:hypothetical protein